MSAKIRQKVWFPAFLSAIMALFIGLLILTWYGASKANPVMLDERGQPRK
jgi:hypothetical protein